MVGKFIHPTWEKPERVCVPLQHNVIPLEDCILVAHDTGEGWQLSAEDTKHNVVCYLKWPDSWPNMMDKAALRNCGFKVV